MTRAKATALVLVNWKGVFYERYWLDPHVTALEGANGAGKTTVMIAAYLVLLPDLSRLRFANVGETGATGGDRGIWGRLGGQSRPSYAALQIEVSPEEWIVAGVMLERRAEPTIEVTPFLVTGVSEDLRLSGLFLSSTQEQEEVNSLDGLRESAGRQRVTLEVFRTVKEYFGALFEMGVTPMRLASDEDRNKLNEMLRTSMTGGISRALTSELRSFVLKQESGLGDALARMHNNLGACRRTRTEVGEARLLERELSGVCATSAAMLESAQRATRRAAHHGELAVGVARDAELTAEARLRAFDTTLEQAEARQHTIERRIDAARTLAAEALAAREHVGRAREAARRWSDRAAELAVATNCAVDLRAAQQRAQAERTSAKRERERAEQTLVSTAEGLANLQLGLDELHRQAHEHRLARSKLAEARQLLDDPGLDEARLGDALESAQREVLAADFELARRDREAQRAIRQQQQWQLALDALRAIQPGAGSDLGDPAAIETCARGVLGELYELEVLAHRGPELAAEKRRLESLLQRLSYVRSQAAALGTEVGSSDVGPALREAAARAEQEVRAFEERERSHAARAQEARREREIVRTRLVDLRHRAGRWPALDKVWHELDAERGPLEVSQEGLEACLATLSEQLGEHRARIAQWQDEHRSMTAQVRSLQAGSLGVDPELGSLADALGGELLARRFEDLDPEEARRTEALLGPLAEALIVEHPEQAAMQALELPRVMSDLWLIHGEAELPSDTRPRTEASQDVVVRIPQGARVTRIAERSRLGRAGRERRIVELEQAIEGLSRTIEQSRRAQRRIEAHQRCARRLLDAATVWLGGDPGPELARLEASVAELELGERNHQQLAHEAVEAARTSCARAQSLRSLASEPGLDEDGVVSARLSEIGREIENAERARLRLRAVQSERRTLALSMDLLCCPPPSAEVAQGWAAERAELEQRRDRWFRVVQTLREVWELRPALAWSEAERVLGERTELVPELRAQYDRARQALQIADLSLQAREREWEEATARCQKAEAEVAALEAHAERARLEIEAEQVDDHSDAAWERASVAAARHEQAISNLLEEQRGLSAEVALARERRGQAERSLGEARERVQNEQARAIPATRAWQDLQAALRESGDEVLPEGQPPSEDSGPCTDPFLEARARWDVLIDRLEAARGGQEMALRLRERGSDFDQAVTYLDAWRAVRDFLRQRIPAEVGDVAHPQVALDHLRDNLEELERRLRHQETDLGGASEDVARGIEVQIRRASTQVRRLNQHLEGISFGGIRAIRIRIGRVERMSQVLGALRDGAVQELLFQPALPIEAALDEIFRRYGGGRSGGQRLLDYREYVELSVQVQRRTSEDWEPANPTRLSTGEAIGVGAALMMVILTEWERDSNLLRPKKRRHSLRFLFLDEANRLSQDNLTVLFDLCQALDLQLLIAAPEVARAEGNTTYRLVRRVSEDGDEEVLVSGRRASLPSEARGDDPQVRSIGEPGWPEEAATEVQTRLFDIG